MRMMNKINFHYKICNIFINAYIPNQIIGKGMDISLFGDWQVSDI